MLLYRITLGIVLLTFFFSLQAHTYQDCIFPKPIEPVLPDIHIAEERVTGLDAFWAQEYVGADLLRKRLSEVDGIEKITHDLVQVWDENKYLHGEYVSQIIAGPFPSAVIPQTQPIAVTKIPDINSVNGYEYLYRQCRNDNNCPAYINNSVSWRHSRTKDILYTMNRREGTVIVTSAGNANKYVSKLKGGLEKLSRLIVVASLDPLGNPSHFSNHSIHTTISAPSDNMIRSYNFDGRPHNFGGSSGATPLTRGALTAFTIITGYLLNTTETESLLKKTAIHFPGLPSSNSMGHGILNAYKIGEVGFKLDKICQNDRDKYDKCISSHLNLDSTYKFHLEEEKETTLRDAQIAFPTCFPENHISSGGVTCEDKHNVLERLRQIAFLDPSDQKFWQAISCIKRESSLTKHAEFYSRLAERLDMSDEDIIHNMMANQDYNLLLKYAISRQNLHQIIMPMLSDENIQSEFLTSALRSIEDILQYYEDIPNLEGILTKAIRHNNADNTVFSAVNDIATDNFNKIYNVEDILRYTTNQEKGPLPTLAISSNLDKLSDPEFFLRMIIENERVTAVDLVTIVDDDLIRYRQELPHFRQFLDEIIHHERSNGSVIMYIFLNIINDYNNTPNAKEIATSLINSHKLDGGHLSRMAEALIENYDQNLDFKEMLRSVINSPRADSETFSLITYSLIQHSENFENFDQIFSTVINHEKADGKSMAESATSFIRYYNDPSNMTNIFQLITNNQHITIACSKAAHTVTSSSSPNSQYYMPTITHIPQKLELIYSNCHNKMDVKGLSSIIGSIRLNIISWEGIPNSIELGMLRFILRQDAIDQKLLDSIANMVQRAQFTDEVRIEINQLIQEAQQKILDI